MLGGKQVRQFSEHVQFEPAGDGLRHILAELSSADPLLDGGGSHIITVGAFLTPLSPGVHTVTISGEFSGVGFQQTSGLAFVDFASTYTITVQPH